MKKLEPKLIQPFGVCGEELFDLYQEEFERQYERRLQDHSADSDLVKQLLRDEAGREAILRVINKNNHKITQDVFINMEDYFFNKFKVDELSTRITALENRLDRLGQNQSAK